MSVVVRELLARDRYALTALIRAVTRREVSDRDRATSAFLADPSTFAFGAYLGEQPVGWTWGVVHRHPDGPLVSYVHEISTVPTVDRGSVASMLLRAVFVRARRAGHTRVWLVTESDDAEAGALYESLGGTRGRGGNVVYRWDV